MGNTFTINSHSYVNKCKVNSFSIIEFRAVCSVVDTFNSRESLDVKSVPNKTYTGVLKESLKLFLLRSENEVILMFLVWIVCKKSCRKT